MNKLTADALRSLDPAPARELTDAEQRRAREALERVVALQPDARDAQQPQRRPRRWSRVLIPLGAAGVAGAFPVLLLGGGSAFASWTSEPQDLTGRAATLAAAACRDYIPSMTDQGERVAIAERRGEWTYVLLTGPRAEASCLMPSSGRDGFATLTTDPEPAPTPEPDGIVEFESMGGSVPSQDWRPFVGHDEWFAWVRGYAGDDVTAVTVHPPVGPAVEASLVDGQFAAWWPAGEADGDNPGVSGAWTYTLTLADGSTREVTEEV